MSWHVSLGRLAGKLEAKAARLFQDRARDRGSRADVDPEGQRHTRLIEAGTPLSSETIREACARGSLVIPDDLGEEGYVIQSGDSDLPVYVAALSERGVLYGLGKLLRLINFTADGEEGRRFPALDLVSRPEKPVRGIYFATHFGNWYCHAELAEVQAYLEDLALWGVNELLVWFDISHYRSLEEGRPMLERLKTFESYAREVGMRTGRTAVSNEGFLGQVGQGRAMLRTNAFDELDYHPLRSRDRVFGGYDTDICPSKPEGRAMVLHNKRMYFSELAEVQSFWLWPYDQGGCNCPECLPWPRTFMELNRELANSLQEAVPGIDVNVSAWWFEGHRKGEDDAFFAYLAEDDKQEASWFKYVMAGAIEARRWKLGGRVLPARHPVVLFPEISMFDSVPWGGKGGNPAPRRFAAEYAELSSGLAGAFPYSEGRYEDLNKVLWAQMMWHSEAKIEQIVEEYCRFYFGAEVEKEAAQLVFDMEDILTGSGQGKSAQQLDESVAAIRDRLKPWARDGWRWLLLELRCRMQLCLEQLAVLEQDLTNAETDARVQEWEKEFTAVYERVQSELNLHRPGASLNLWIHATADKALDFFLGREDVINLTLDNLMNDDDSTKLGSRLTSG
ncbi:hypothetical protein [Paenibacillus eucommiae]|uniref:Beta-hexosaminidase bacterial type N-terminal domain-containing protein n=1 Tax=Paenibacillus eucommiae TaxID=1355755 RepID=A0ABS4IVF9_9BACL|nr:hypothetical protein [Paenibacillus eucommiae]MBP1991498.1 hypothetical protein [Paenibacillus eucommiae]